MGLVKLNVSPRKSSGKNENRRTRAAGQTPAVLYGHDREATSVQLDTVEFTRILKKTGGRAVIFDLTLEGESENPIALMRDLQRHPVTDEIFHVDLYEIPRGVPVEVHVPLRPEGEPASVKFGEGEVNLLTHSVTLSCLPRDLPDAVAFDISALKVNDSVYVKDLTPPVGEIVDDPDLQVLVVKPATVFGLDDDEAGAETEAAAPADGDADKD
ncbi:MAG: 50S ribosomal protein L25 [Candidatus Krumholzibacteriia bacterium]